MESDNKQKDEDDKIFIAKTPLEIQRLKLEKLMKNPDLMDAAYHQKLEEHRRAAEERTAKKRAKRLKKKQKARKRPKSENLSKSENSNSASEYSAESGSSGDEENK
ncbi:uncharacterized protein F37A4.2 isoform X2 [Schistocerca piceifrons]|uniref:uncharacterized protein F37A4.2 isoform X2 n=1 Tax=Schistocerca piceifrons TaxID=274613 RepID=UPI001F5FC3DB|nr:uncharacterized protein F37A4.2 isoform X2 [Schistocerca piceifrons]